jgi:hypothetical protein
MRPPSFLVTITVHERGRAVALAAIADRAWHGSQHHAVCDVGVGVGAVVGLQPAQAGARREGPCLGSGTMCLMQPFILAAGVRH